MKVNNAYFRRGTQLLSLTERYMELLLMKSVMDESNSFSGEFKNSIEDKYLFLRNSIRGCIFDNTVPVDFHEGHDENAEVFGTTAYYLKQFYTKVEEETNEYIHGKRLSKEYIKNTNDANYELLNYVKMNRRSL